MYPTKVNCYNISLNAIALMRKTLDNAILDSIVGGRQLLKMSHALHMVGTQ